VVQDFPIIEASRPHSDTPQTPLDESSARRNDLYPITHNSHKQQTSMPPTRCAPTMLARERLQTHALDRTATGIGKITELAFQTSSRYVRSIFQRNAKETNQFCKQCNIFTVY